MFACACWPSVCLPWRNVCSGLWPRVNWAVGVFAVELWDLLVYFRD